MIRELTKLFPHAIASWLLGEPVAGGVYVVDSKVHVLLRETDRLLRVERKPGPALMLHIEFQTTRDPSMGKRMSEYMIAARAQPRRSEEPPPDYAAVVVYVDRKRNGTDPMCVDSRNCTTTP